MAEQTIDLKTWLKWAATAASALWVVLTIYQEFFDVDPTNYGFRSPEVEARMKACTGSFQQRYDCKEAIIIAKGYASFLIWSEKGLLVLGPPLLLSYLVNRISREKPAPKKIRRPAKPTPPVTKRRVR